MEFSTSSPRLWASLLVTYALFIGQATAALVSNEPSSTGVGQMAGPGAGDGVPLSGAFSETFVLPVASYSVTSFTWWGYYLESDPSANPDKFFANGFDLAGLYTVSSVVGGVELGEDNFADLYKYVLDLSASPQAFGGGTATISLSNESEDLVWFWQGTGPAESDARAYVIDGTRAQAVPEPGSLALVGLALAGLAVFRTRARTRR